MSTAPAAPATAFADALSHIDEVALHPARSGELVAYLDERHPCYAGQGAGDAERLRGFLLARFAVTGLPPTALPHVAEELESGLDPYGVAGAARALRGCGSAPPEAVGLLLAAVERLKSNDKRVSFDSFAAPSTPAEPATALVEIFRTIAWLAPLASAAEKPLKDWLAAPAGSFSETVRAEMAAALAVVTNAAETKKPSCCATQASPLDAAPLPSVGEDLWSTALQDQDGAGLTLGAALLGKPAVLAFFYTRCMNPEKCSLTIVKLARLQQCLAEAGLQGRVNIAALSYDPKFDLPARLRTYGKDRGLQFDASVRLLRTTGDFDPLIAALDLGVGYGPVTVNRHRLDLLVFDKTGRPRFTKRRRSWQPEEVFEVLSGEITRESC